MPIFRYTEQPGNYYAYLIESSGDDANDGLTPETAVATLDRLVEILDTYAGTYARVAVIRKNRIYNEGITYTRNIIKPITFEFVGGCEIDGSGSTCPVFKGNGDTLINCTLKNTPADILTIGGTGTNITTFINCRLYDCLRLRYASGASSKSTMLYFINSLVVNVFLIQPQYADTYRGVSGQNSIFINCSNGGYVRFYGTINCIFINNPLLKIWDNTYDLNEIRNCNIRGLIYDKTNEQLVALGVNVSGINEEPFFTDESNGVYTVKSFSPCLYRGENAAHIGLGEGFYLTASQLLTNAETNDNFQISSGRLTFIDPNDNALLQTYPIDAGSFVTIERADLAAIIGTVGADISSTAVVLSHWYPAYNSTYNYHTGAGITDSGIKYKSLQDDNLNQAPATETLYWERMTWESGVSYSAGKIVQYTDDKWYKANTATSTSWVAGEWDEVVLIRQFNFYIKTGRTFDECNDADYSIVPFNDVPLIDVAGKGNSEDNYDPTTGASITFRFISIKIHAKTVL